MINQKYLFRVFFSIFTLFGLITAGCNVRLSSDADSAEKTVTAAMANLTETAKAAPTSTQSTLPMQPPPPTAGIIQMAPAAPTPDITALCTSVPFPSAAGAVTVRFINNTTAGPVTGFWVNNSGQLEQQFILQPGESGDMTTYAGARFLINNDIGATLLDYTVAAQPNTQCAATPGIVAPPVVFPPDINALCAAAPPTSSPVAIRFINNFIGPVTGSWVNNSGQLEQRFTLQVGEFIDWAPSERDRYVIADPFGNPLLDYTTTSERSQCAAAPPPAVAPPPPAVAPPPPPVVPPGAVVPPLDPVAVLAACAAAPPPPPTHQVMVRFINNTAGPLDVFWVDRGNWVFNFTCQSGQPCDMSTTPGHRFVLEDAAGDIALDYTATTDITQCTEIR